MHLKKALKFIIVFLIIFGWIFSGWPQIWRNPSIPSKIKEAQAAVTYVGGQVGSFVGKTSATTVTFALTNGSASTPAAGDLVIVAYSVGSTADRALTIQNASTVNYTLAGSELYQNDNFDSNLRVAYRFMPSPTPETSMVLSQTFSTNDAGAYTIHVFRGVDPSTPLDVAAVIAGAINTRLANPGSILPITSGALIYVVGAAAAATGGTYTAAYLTDFRATTQADNNDAMIGSGYVNWTSGTYDPAIFTGGGTASSTDSWNAVTLALRPAPTVVAPTVTLSVATNKEATTATLNGEVTATGGENPTVTVYWGDNDGGQVAGNWDNNFIPTSPGQPQGAATFYKDVTGLPSGTTIYFSAKATNSGGDGWPAASLNFLTKPAVPTDISATDGTYTDKVTITWTKSTGATDYHVWRDSTDLGSAGDVAILDDAGANAPTITPGSAAASDGTNSTYVELTLSGASANNGTTHSYKVVASNATGNSADSTPDDGYRGHGSLTYQWQRSAADSDASYSNIDGATTASYNDTGAPADGSGRYYKCVENATGATQQISAADRGYRAVAVYSVSVSDGNVTYGTLNLNASRSTLLGEENEMQTATNDSNVAAKLNIKGTVSSPGGWTLAGTAAPNVYVHMFCNDTDLNCSSPPTNYTALTTNYTTLKASVPVSGTVDFQLRITTPTSVSNYAEQNVDVWVQAVQQ